MQKINRIAGHVYNGDCISIQQLPQNFIEQLQENEILVQDIEALEALQNLKNTSNGTYIAEYVIEYKGEYYVMSD